MLSDRDYAILTFEKAWGERHPRGAKEAAAREAFGLDPTRYHAELARIVMLPEAEALEPVVVHGLRDLLRRREVLRSRRRTGSVSR